MSFLTKIVEPSFRQTLRFNGELNSDQVIAYVHSMEGDYICWKSSLLRDSAGFRTQLV